MNLAPSGYLTNDLFNQFPSHCTDCVVTADQCACSAICAAHVFKRRQCIVETAENGACNITCTCSKLLRMVPVTLLAHAVNF
jgi:hypothetical protein